MVTKIAAYIFRRRPRGNELLVFAHRDFPDVPLQVPGGTVDEGEELTAALFREISEESGLSDVTLIRKLGVYRFHWDQIHDDVERHFYLLESGGPTPERWQHEVEGVGVDNGLVFTYSWVKTDDTLSLAGDLGQFINRDDAPELYS